jgi:hypothetical protein
LFWNSDETVPVWKEKKTCAKDMHDLWCKNTEHRNDRNTNLEKKKRYAVAQ